MVAKLVVDRGKSVRFVKAALGAAVGEVNQTTSPHVSMASIRVMLVPVPPVAEQKRIVAKLDELMGLLDRLAKRLDDKTIAHDAFAAAAVHHLEV